MQRSEMSSPTNRLPVPSLITLLLNQIYHLYPNPAMAHTFCCATRPVPPMRCQLNPARRVSHEKGNPKTTCGNYYAASRVLLPIRRLLPSGTDVLSTDIRLSEP